MTRNPEVWLRGPVEGIAPVLQPVAHALLQVAEDLPTVLGGLTPEELWARPGGSAPIGFHLAHLTGSLDRLLTYARGESLSPEQQAALAAERAVAEARPGLAQLLAAFQRTCDAALAQLRATEAGAVLAAREVGRARLPSTVLGLLFHAAEHTARHAGQIATLVKVVRG
ncbi:MAG TPA: DinB family protein [Gemmatimonadales bacterium]|jgi:hypothetical protein|nr:DinB family protein [Gemmatimonadales bacterium]